MPEMFWMTTFLWCELTFDSRMLNNVCERCHSERSEESRSGLGGYGGNDQNEIPLPRLRDRNDRPEGFSSILKEDVANDF